MAELKLRGDAVEWRHVEGQVVALDLRAAEYLSVNRTGATVWAALADGSTRGAMTEKLIAAYGIDEEAAGRDLDAFLASLDERGLLEESE